MNASTPDPPDCGVIVIFTLPSVVGRGRPDCVNPLSLRLVPFTMNRLPCARSPSTLAPSAIVVIVGGVGPTVPPVVIVPAPLKLNDTLGITAAVPVRLANDPVARRTPRCLR